ncbi:MAG: metal-dependent transcriptional regulator [Thermoplasmata archaeon]|nr:metal-dependent transcriptional regulator [Thermoplasmata archaeon]
MNNESLTNRDEEYLRAVFLLNGLEEPVGPTKLANILGINKVSCYEKMRRLESLGLGKYVLKKGFLLNSEGASLAQSDIHRHHVLEKFIQNELGFSSKDACRESSRMGPHVSTEFMESILEKLGDNETCECGYCFNPPYDPKDLTDCHWCQPYFPDR